MRRRVSVLPLIVIRDDRPYCADSIPNTSGFFWYPRRIRRYLSRDLYREDSFQAQYVIYYTYSHDAYRKCSPAVEERLLEHWYGEILIFRKGRGGGDLISMDRRRGDTDRIIWQVIERYGAPLSAPTLL